MGGRGGQELNYNKTVSDSCDLFGIGFTYSILSTSRSTWKPISSSFS